MNTRLHRIVFNRHRGQCVAVAEHQGGQGKAESVAVSVGAGCWARVRPLAWTLCLTLGWVTAVGAQIVADPNAPRGQQATVLSTGNGLPLVNIQTPSAAGVSRNTYSQFDVGAGGAVLNNSRTNVQTQQGGWVQGNPWLATGSARIILNEVTGPAASQLKGYVEVAGQRAEVVIANPAGITCAGCGFINAGQVTLTTGTPVVKGGALDGFVVERGVIAIDGAGLDARGADYTALLARAVEVNAGVWAQNLRVDAGAQRLDAQGLRQEAAATTVASPVVAIDVGQLGGMYAGKIWLVGTDAGVGVRNAGQLGASVGEFVVTAEGRLENRGRIDAAGALTLRADEIDNAGTLTARNTVELAAANGLTHTGGLGAAQAVKLEAGTLASSGWIVAGLDGEADLAPDAALSVQVREAARVSGAWQATGEARIEAGGLDASGLQLSAHDAQLAAVRGPLALVGAQLSVEGGASLSTPGALLTDGAQLAATQWQIQARDWSNVRGELVSTGTADWALSLPGTIDNREGRIATNAQNFGVTAARFDNRGGRLEHAGTGAFTLALGEWIGTGGALSSNGALDLRGDSVVNDGATLAARQITVAAGRLTNRGGALLQTGTGTMALTVNGALDNTGGQIGAAGALALSAGELFNARGEIGAAEIAQVHVRGAIDNTEGAMAAATLAVSSDALANSRGAIQAGKGELQLQVRVLDNQAGSLLAATDLRADVDTLHNTGTLYAAANQTLRASGAVSNTGQIAAAGDLSLAAQSIEGSAGSLLAAGLNAQGQLGRSGTLSLTAEQDLGIHGQTLAADALQISAAQIDLAASTLQAAQASLQATQGPVSTRGAQLDVAGALVVGARQAGLDNTGGKILAGELELDLARLGNAGGVLAQAGTRDLGIAVAGDIDNRGGTLSTNAANLQLVSATLDNTGGRIEHAGSGTLAVQANQLTGERGAILSNGAIEVQAGSFAHAGATLAAQSVAVQTGALDNQEGKIIASGSGPDALRIDVAGVLDNAAGTLASAGGASIAAARLDNTAGRIQAAEHVLSLAVSGTLDNRQAGQLASGAALALQAGELLNTQGAVLAAGALDMSVRDRLDNQTGTLAANGALTLAAGEIDNRRGLVASAEGDARLSSAAIDNSAGRIEAARALVVEAGTLANRGGTLLGETARITASGALDNTSGTVAAQRDAIVHAEGIDNTAGLLQAGGALALDAGAGTLINQSSEAHASGAGGVVAGAALALAAASLDNRSGFVGAGGAASIGAAALDNRGGLIVGEQAVTVTGSTLDNHGGQIQAVGEVHLSLAASLDNTAGLVRSGAALAVQAGQILNRETASPELGLEASDITLAAAALDNSRGEVRAAHDLSIASSGRIDNTQGLLSAGKRLSIADAAAARTLAVTNTGGTVIGGQQLDVAAERLSGDGRLLSLGDLSLTLSGAFINTAEVLANGAAHLHFEGAFDNRGVVRAGTELAVQAAAIDNALGGEIAGTTTRINVSGALTNRGLIDGVETRIEAASVENIGTGRIYGDHLAIGAGELVNREETVDGRTAAGTIAARERLDLGVGALLNQEHALIFSGGDMAIGGALDAAGRATGRAARLINASATIESLGDMRLAVDQGLNRNNHFSTALVTVGREQVTEYGFAPHHPKGNGTEYDYVTRFAPDQVRIWNCESLCMQDLASGQFSDQHDRYDYTRVTQETRVTSSDPGRIQAGGSMRFEGGTWVNDQSRILSGGLVQFTGAAPTLVSAEGERIVNDLGTVIQYRRVRKNGPDTFSDNSVLYAPPAVTTVIELKSDAPESLSGAAGTGTQVEAVSQSGVQATVAAVGGALAKVRTHAVGGVATAVDPTAAVKAAAVAATPAAQLTGGAAPGALIKVALTTPQGKAQQVRATPVDVRVPESSLFKVNPGASGNYLIETDPRFASYRNWLSSDYLLTQMGLDPTAVQKRLGDGFYEQKLVREQVAQLTGFRYLEGYADDEAQYRALLAAGATFGAQHQLRPGVALTAEQMAALTSDIVWLVEREVVLPDGSVTRALVPQVYVRVQEGDIDGNGALLTGRNVVVEGGGADLVNHGTIAGREVVSLTAENVRNLGGRIQGAAVSVKANTDLENLGGSISAQNALVLSAGRDLKVESSTRTASNAQGSVTHLDRVAGLYVTDPNGILAAQAGRDAVLTAAVVSNAGAGGVTAITAGRDLTLGTVQTGRSDNIVFDARNTSRTGTTAEVGTQIQVQGDVRLAAGQDLNARAASVTSEAGAVVATAARDVKIEAGQASQSWDVATYSTGKSGLSKVTSSAHAEGEATQAQASRFSGQTVAVQGGRDVAVTGSQVVSTDGTTVVAGRDLTIAAAQDTYRESVDRTETKKGLMGAGTGFTIGTQEQGNTQTRQGTRAAGSTVGSVAGDVTLVAGGTYHQEGSAVLAPQGDVTIVGKKVEIVEARQSEVATDETRFKQSGLTVAVSGGAVSAVQAGMAMKDAAKASGDARMTALAVAAGGLGAANAVTEMNKAMAEGDKTGGIALSITAGTSRSQSKTTTTSETAAGSSVQAGGRLAIQATGAGADSTVTVRGSDLAAGGNALIAADGKILLEAARNDVEQQTRSSSSSAAAGVTVGVGQKGAQFGVTASGSVGRGSADGADTTWTHTHVNSGGVLTLQSGGDTELKGAVASGQRVVGEVGGKLIVESLQDSSTYASKDWNVAASASYGGSFSANVSASQAKVNADLASVREQSAIRAGDGGFQIKAKDETVLAGGAISSTQAAVDAGANRLETAAVVTSDLTNRAHFDAQAISVSAGTGGASAGGGQKSGEASSVTAAGVSGAEVVITDAAKQQALTGQSGETAVASLNRNVTTGVDTSGALTKTWDEQKLKEQVQANAAITQQFGQQGTKAWGTYANAKFIDAVKAGDSDAAQCWGPDGACRAGGHMLIGGLGGGVAGALGAGVSSVSTPHLIEALKAQGVSESVAGSLATLAAAGLGGAVGGTHGAVGAANEAANNAALFAPMLREAVLKGGPLVIAACVSSEQCKNALGEAGLATAQKALETVDKAGSTAPVPPGPLLLVGLTQFLVEQLAGAQNEGKPATAPEVGQGQAVGGGYPAGTESLPLHTGNTSGAPELGQGTTSPATKPEVGSGTSLTPPAVDNNPVLEASKYVPNAGGVGNMGEFFRQPGFGTELADQSRGTPQIYDGQKVYVATSDQGVIRDGDKFYLDGTHKNHLEVFDGAGKFRYVVNLDGTVNQDKTEIAKKQGRRLPKQ